VEIRSGQTAFAEKHGLLAQAHELTKSRRKSMVSLHFISIFALSHSLCNHFAITLDSRKEELIKSS
jgi:hypothetical protein